jgi:hypothetical protein
MSNLAEDILKGFSDEERLEIKSWAEKAIVIRNDESLNQIQKVKKLYEESWRSSVITKFLKAFLQFIKKHGWDERSMPARITMSGAALGFVTMGTKLAGIASAGIGVGLPFFVLTGAGGALLGVIIQEATKGQKK